MKKQTLLLFAGFIFCALSLQAQQVFKGTIMFKTSFGGDKKLIEQAKVFMGTSTEIVTDGKNFRYYTSGGMRDKEFIFETGKETYYRVNAKEETATKELFRKKSDRSKKLVLKKTGKVKIIAGAKTQHIEMYGGDKKRAEIWVSDEYKWNLTDHPYRVQGLMLVGSFNDLDCKVILGLRMFHPSGKAHIDTMAEEIDVNTPKKSAFGLPNSFKVKDNTQKHENKPKETKSETKGGGR